MISPNVSSKLTKALVAAALLAGAAFAMPTAVMAGGVDWSVRIGTGVPVYAAPPVVVAPQPVYVAPAPVVVAPQPVYYSGYLPYGQVVYYDAWSRPYYVERGRNVYLRGWHDHDHDHDHGHGHGRGHGHHD